MKLQLPLISLLYPHGAEMLIARGRALIFLRLFADDGVVGDDRGCVVQRDDLDAVGRQLQKVGVAQVVDGFPLLQKSSVDTDQREIVAESSSEEYDVVFFLGFDQRLLVGDEGLLDGA